jgi:hypothetical protein
MPVDDGSGDEEREMCDGSRGHVDLIITQVECVLPVCTVRFRPIVHVTLSKNGIFTLVRQSRTNTCCGSTGEILDQSQNFNDWFFDFCMTVI